MMSRLCREAATFGSFRLTEEQASSYLNLILHVRSDDAFIAYVNGVKAAQSDRVPTAPAWNSYAAADTSSDTVSRQLFDYVITDPAVLDTLRAGQNILAVHALNSSNSSDFLVSFSLDVTRTVPASDQNNLARQRAIFNHLRITEIMSHPSDGSDLEYIELQNIGTEDLDITGVRLGDGIEFTCPAMTLAAGEYMVVVNNSVAFQARYGTDIRIAGEYEGNLDNGGETILLQLPAPFEAAILRIEYSDAWYPSTDGQGYALVIRDVLAPRDAWNRASGWTAGLIQDGTPGTAD